MPDTTTQSPSQSSAGGTKNRRVTVVFAIAIAVVMLTVYLLSPVRQVNDSAYSMMLSQCLIEHRSFQLDHYNIPRNPPVYREEYRTDGNIYQLDLVGNHIYYFFPPGSSVLSVPFVEVIKLFGISAVAADGSYDSAGELQVEGLIAAILMSVLCAVFFLIAELLLPQWLAMFVAIAGGLGTQVWSTTSRAMYTDTWAILLLTTVVYLIARTEFTSQKMRPVLIAMLLSWTYFTAPVYSVHIAAISAFVFIYYRRYFLQLAATGAAWFAGFVGWSWYNFHQLRPNYFKATRLGFEHFGEAIFGNLISPSRGFLVFVPAVLFVIYLVVRYRRQIEWNRLVILAETICFLHLVAVSAFNHWWGGHSYGPRFMTGSIPWILLLAVMGLDAMRKQRKKGGSYSLRSVVEIVIALLLISASILINGRGAIAQKTLVWNSRPVNVDRDPERLWDWRYPQFMAGLIHPSLPSVFPDANNGLRISLDSVESEEYLWYGWSDSEPGFRWTDARRATIVFGVVGTPPQYFRVKLLPYVAGVRLPQQRVSVLVNGVQIKSLDVNAPDFAVYEIQIPPEILKPKNILTFDLPNATSPSQLSESDDDRSLALKVEWIEFDAN